MVIHRYRAQVSTMDSWSDDPITELEQDRFDRARFAGLVAKKINAVPLGAASTVFGLVGRWGSGKSSVAGLVRHEMDDTWIVQQFTPWAAAGVDGLQLEFVLALDNALGGARAEEQAARDVLKKYSHWARVVLSTVPGVGVALGESTERAVADFAARRPWAEEFGDLANSLEGMDRRVLIVCDDIDRLDATELLELLKVVRLLGRFPNVHYLVAYDADTVEDLLAAQGISGRTSSFMEKIVQHPFELPPIDRATRWRHLSDAMSQALDSQGVDLDEAGMERYRLLIDALSNGLATPRQFARFEHHLTILAGLVPGEVDPLDFAAVAYLRLNHHEVYESLPAWAPMLRAGIAGSSTGNTQSQGGLSENDWQDAIAKQTRRSDIAGAWDAIRFLYPSLRPKSGRSLHPQAFADPLYEERYFTLGVPENDVSDVLVARAVSSWLGQKPDPESEAKVKDTLTTSHPSIARLMLQKLHKRRLTQLHLTAPVRPLLDFLNDERVRNRPSQDQPESPFELIMDWQSDELVRGYSASEFGREDLMDWLGEEAALELVGRATAPPSSGRNPELRAVLNDFVSQIVTDLSRPGIAGLEPVHLLRQKVLLLDRARDDEDLFDDEAETNRSGLLDAKVDGDLPAFEATAVAMVRIARWRSGTRVHPRLEFDQHLWQAAVSEPVQRRMADQLTSEFDNTPVDIEDVSDHGRRRFAIVRAREGRRR
ncbi:MAG: hypothetical protein E2601_01265 [Microbacterium sp.]|nr:hypothetical protein [Microbacterium sp.]